MIIKRGRGQKKGQVMVFVVLAVLIVGVIAVLFFLKARPQAGVADTVEVSVEEEIESCLKDSLREAVLLVEKHGGSVEGKGIMYGGSLRNYLCYTNRNIVPCVNHRPLLLDYVEGQISEHVLDQLGACEGVVENLRNEGYTVYVGSAKVESEIVEDRVAVMLNWKLEISKSEFEIVFENFEAVVSSRLYSLIDVARRIIDVEASKKEWHFVGLPTMVNDPSVRIYKIARGDSTVYRIEKGGEEFVFAVRGKVLP